MCLGSTTSQLKKRLLAENRVNKILVEKNVSSHESYL